MRHLTTSDTMTARVMSHWETLFGLICEDRDYFLAYYSKSKEILHKLKIWNSVAVTDDLFLKVYFAMVIEAPELQLKVRSFLKDLSKLFNDIDRYIDEWIGGIS